MTGNRALLEEATSALKAAPRGGTQTTWVASDRRRLVPYLALGGASIGMLIGVVSAGAQGLSNREELLGVGLIAGVPIGIGIGWGSFGLAGILVRAPTTLLHVLRMLLSIPTYLSASVAAFVGIRLYSGTADDLLASFGGVLPASAIVGVLVIPLSFAIARRGPAVSATTLSGTIGETLDGGGGARLSNVGGTAIIAFVWFLVASFATLGGMALLRSVAPAAYDSAFEVAGTAMRIGLLVVWVATIVAGTAFTRRLVYGRFRSTRGER